MEAMTSEREAFEKWARERDWPLFRCNQGFPDAAQYEDTFVSTAWCAWKARAHLAQPAQAVDVGAARLQARANEIERAIVCGEMDVYQVFTQMRQLLPRALSGEKAGPVGDGWQPIETAPKDGTSVLLAFGGKKPVGGWWNDDRYAKVPRPYWSTDNERIVGIPWLRSNPPIAWMPLPASPTPDKEGA